ncbi:MAG TPA: ATP-binding protein, partial [Candidatus Dormibacteraeota bacterium]|nr:ATP-binding protein [Candidatus Dormibacteraeota bacterium]
MAGARLMPATDASTPARDRLLVPVDKLRRRLDPALFPFESTAAVQPLEGTMGQPRALEAIEFGLESGGFGYNLFVSGAPGSGRASTVLSFLERYAKTLPRPDDWVYVHNFENLDGPAAIRLPGGLGRGFADDMARFIDRARQQISQALETERFDEQRRARLAKTEKERDSLVEALQAFGLERGFAVQPTPSGFVTIPIREGHPMTPEEVQHLSDTERHDLQRRAGEVEAKVESEIRQLQQVAREAAEDLTRLEHEVAMFAVEPLFGELRDKYAAVPEVVAHLEAIRGDIPHHIADFRGEQEHAPQMPATLREMGFRDDHTDRYRVNLLVDRDGIVGAPIVIERNPTYYNLIGRIEYRASFGAMFTDFRQIK